jgi:phosphoribosyl-dephospho-CoA transferase
MFQNEPVVLRVYGSAFWSYEDGSNRMNTQSDIDLLIQVKKTCDVINIAKKCVAFSKVSGVSLDGEIEFPNGESVSWREFASDSQELLVKTDIGPKLIGKNLVLKAFNAAE